MFQTNIREIDAGLDEREVVSTIVGLDANAWLLNAGGIVAFYPSHLSFQHPSPWLSGRASGDLIADAVTEAHRRQVSFVARIDFSKIHSDTAEKHRDWCFVGVDGRPQIYNDLYSVCPSGPYYQERCFEILAEILDRYEVDGFFFNWFNFNQHDYSGANRGICQCYNCKRRFVEQTGFELPIAEDWSDPSYVAWVEFGRRTLADLALRIRTFIHNRRPEVALLLRQSPDVIMHEVNNAINRPQPIWVNSAGEMARTSRSDHPETPAWLNTVTFVDLPYRFTAEESGFIGLDLVQTFAFGANPSSYIIGTPDLADQRILDTTAELFSYHRENTEFYDDLEPAAKVLLIKSPRTAEIYGGDEQVRKVIDEFRGVYRALTESHIPFDILTDGELRGAAADGRLDYYDAVVLPNIAVLDADQVVVLDAFVESGGGLVATYDTGLFDTDGREIPDFRLRSLGVESIGFRREGQEAVRSSCLMLTNKSDVPTANANTMLALEDAFIYVHAQAGAVESMSYRSPTRYGPPEKCYGGVDTEYPGRVTNVFGKGTAVYFPWAVGGLYYRLGLTDYRSALTAAVDSVLTKGRLLRTNAPAQLEVTITRQRGQNRVLAHLINYTGYQGRAFYEPLELRNVVVDIRVPGGVSRARAVRAGLELDLTIDEDYVSVTVPAVGLFELIVFDL